MTLAPANLQANLLDVIPRPIVTNNGQARNAYGAVAQEIVCAVLGLTPIKINGNFEICFDAQKGSLYYEIKSVRHKSKIVVYKWRLAKEKSAGVRVSYAILVHNVKGEREFILEKMLHDCRILLVPLPVMERAVEGQCVRKHKIPVNVDPRNGYCRKGYVDGYWNLPVHELFQRVKALDVKEGALYGIPYSVPVYAV